MAAKLKKLEVGPWPMNCYIIFCTETNSSIVVDPGADAGKILSLTNSTNVAAIILTHGHPDHVGALDQVKKVTAAPIFLHPKDAAHFNLSFDYALKHNEFLTIGNLRLRVIHTPGHTPGQTSIDLDDNRILVGDTIFVGGPGRTWNPEDFTTTMNTMQDIVFQWPDETEFFPGHGSSGKIGKERQAFEKFLEKGWSKGLHGDVTWES